MNLKFYFNLLGILTLGVFVLLLLLEAGLLIAIGTATMAGSVWKYFWLNNKE